MTSGWGPGASPYKVAELVGFADTHLLTDRLNSFEETGTWGSPTLDGLRSTLRKAARTNATVFIRALPDLVGVLLCRQDSANEADKPGHYGEPQDLGN